MREEAALRRCTMCRASLDISTLWCGVCGRRSRIRADSRPGAILDDAYRIEEKLAEGGFGAVYRATHLATGMVVALKIMHADVAAVPRHAERFRRESRTLANLRGPASVATFERGELRDGTLFIAMELLRGETLEEKLARDGVMPWRDAVRVLRAMCDSLAQAHANGIVHRDVKPANIHLGEDGIVRIIDFGIACAVPGSELDDRPGITERGEALGTLEYMAPEQIAGGACVPESDVYALGVVAFEMICGVRPFGHASTAACLMTLLFTESARPPSALAAVPENIDRLLLRCLEREPAHRYSSASALASAIDTALATGVTRRPARHARILETPEEAWRTPPGLLDLPKPPNTDAMIVWVTGALLVAVGAAMSWVVLAA